MVNKSKQSKVMSRRFSATSVLDVGELQGYYNRLDVFVSFTDTGKYDYTGKVDRNIRPTGIFAYMINDVVGRISRESTLYGRVFRYKTVDRDAVSIDQYRMDDYESDVKKMERIIDDPDIIDRAFVLTPSRVPQNSAFAHLWVFTYLVALWTSSGSSYQNRWTEILTELGYSAFVDKRGTGIISKNRKPSIIIFDENGIEELEIVSTQKHKKDLSTYTTNWVTRHNNRTDVSNSRRRIKK